MAPYESLDFATIDHHRAVRHGYPEVVYGEGKNPEQVTLLTPKVFSSDDLEALKGMYAPEEQPGWSTFVDIEPYTHYNGSADVSACKGPGE